MDEFLMSKSEVCEYLDVSTTRLNWLEEHGYVKAVRRLIGGKKLYSSTSVYEYLQSVWTGGDADE